MLLSLRLSQLSLLSLSLLSLLLLMGLDQSLLDGPGLRLEELPHLHLLRLGLRLGLGLHLGLSPHLGHLQLHLSTFQRHGGRSGQ